jgi:hypothetical protein
MMVNKALDIGINTYPYPNQLQGCINDMNDYLVSYGSKGFTTNVLQDSLATRSNWLAGLNALVSGVVSGDHLAFSYSGHGSRIVDTSGDETDGYDECLVPVDYQTAGFITDDDLRAIFQTLPSGVTLDVFLDCCYSGTGTRVLEEDKNVKAKYLFNPDEKLDKNIPCKSKIFSFITEVPGLNHCLWTACQSNQLAYEVLVGGTTHRGAFSYYVNPAIRSSNTRAYDINYVQTKVAKILGSNQTPQLECTVANSLRQPFT